MGDTYTYVYTCVELTVKFVPDLIDKPGLLQEVLLYHGTLNDTSGVEVDVNVLAKPTGVVITVGLGITKGCKSGRDV